MGQKTHPIGFRLGVNKTWDSRWYANQEYSKFLHEDLKARAFLKKKLRHAGVSKVEIERVANKTKVNIHTSRPGIVIGKKGSGIDGLRGEVKKYIKTTPEVFLNIIEVRKAEANAQLIAENIADQLQRRIAFRRAMKKAMSQAFKFGVKGIKVQCRGRLGGTDIARTERYAEGSVPLHTLRADVDYGTAEAYTTYGQIGIKVWVYKGEVLRRRRRTTSVPASTNRAPANAPGSEVGAS